MLVRSVVEACEVSVPKAEASKASASAGTDVDDLTALLSGLSVQKASPHTIDRSGINIIHSGELVPQSSILEIKTKSAFNFKGIDWDDYLPQLVLSQIPHLVVGLHDRGLFHTVTHKKMDDSDVVAEKRKLDSKLRLLRDLLETIRRLVKGRGKDKRYALVYRDRELRMYEKESSESCLPQEWMARFETRPAET